MRKVFVVPTAVVLTLVTLGATACGSSTNNTAAVAAAHKKTFCAANVKVDKAGASVDTTAAFLVVLKANKDALKTMDDNAPAGKVGREAHALVKLADTAIATNNPNSLFSSNNGGDVDTYCGVDANGDPLPADFGAGKGTAFCSVSDAIDQGTQNASSAAQVLTFLSAHQTLINQYATYVPGLPSSVRTDAQTLVTTARAAIAANNSNSLGTSAISQDSMAVTLYCGNNE